MNDASLVDHYDMQVCHDMQVYYVMLCRFDMLWYASLPCYVMQVCHVMICKFIMLCYASFLCYDMQVCHMICKLCYASLGWSFCSCYASLSWVYELKASSFMLKVAFWQHVSYHIPYDNLHVRLNANLWPFLHVI